MPSKASWPMSLEELEGSNIGLSQLHGEAQK